MMPVAWRTRWWTWAVPLAVVIANAVVLIVHPGRTGAGFAEMEKQLQSETRVLADLEEKEKAMRAVLEEARGSRVAVARLYTERFSTEAERLTRLITEVKRLAQRAGLEPKSISYPEETLDEYGLVRMSLVFGVRGSYPQLRMLVNLIERSELFLVLDKVGLSDSQDAALGIRLEISTFFVRDPAEGVPGAGGAAPGADQAKARRTQVRPSEAGVEGGPPAARSAAS